MKRIKVKAHSRTKGKLPPRNKKGQFTKRRSKSTGKSSARKKPRATSKTPSKDKRRKGQLALRF